MTVIQRKWMGLGIAVLVACSAPWAESKTVGVKTGALVTQLVGNNQLIAGGKTYPLKTRQVVSPGHRIKTGANGRAELTFADGTRLRLGPVTDLTLVYQNPSQNHTITRLNQGKAWNNVKPGGNKKFVTQGRHSTNAVLGTVYDVEVNVSVTISNVFHGNVGVHRPFEDEDNPETIIESTPKQFEPTPQATAGFGPPRQIENPVHEVPPPMKVIPGPYAVSLDQWLQIVENQRIEMNADGKASVTEFDLDELVKKNEWIRWNQLLDKNPPQNF